MRTDRKNVVSIKTRLQISEHKNRKKKLLTLNQRFLLHVILLLLDQMNPPEMIEKCNEKNRFFESEIVE